MLNFPRREIESFDDVESLDETRWVEKHFLSIASFYWIRKKKFRTSKILALAQLCVKIFKNYILSYIYYILNNKESN